MRKLLLQRTSSTWIADLNNSKSPFTCTCKNSTCKGNPKTKLFVDLISIYTLVLLARVVLANEYGHNICGIYNPERRTSHTRLLWR